MNESSDSATSRTDNFATGFVSAILLLVALGAGVRVAEWVASHPLPAALVELVTTPVLSVYDVVIGLIMLVMLWAIHWMIAYGPRMR